MMAKMLPDDSIDEWASAEDAPCQDAAAEMAYEDACKVKNSKGMEYGEIPSDKLAHMVNSIVTALKTDLTPEDRAEREYKRDAILCILNHRATEAK